jgi:arylsulfate sulfotransferase
MSPVTMLSAVLRVRISIAVRGFFSRILQPDNASFESEKFMAKSLGTALKTYSPWSAKLLSAEGEVGWPYHQHGVNLTPRGTLLLFDNGGERAVPPDPGMPEAERYSRAVEYRINEEAGTVEEVWSYGPAQERFISPFISDADHLPQTGNVLVTDGGRMAGPDGEVMTTFGGRQWAHLMEVTYDGKEKVWELVSDDPERRFSVYRAERRLSLYPELDRLPAALNAPGD